MNIWHNGFGRQSSVQRESIRKEMLRRGLAVRQHIHPEANVPTIGERLERFLERMHVLTRMDGGFYRDTRSPFTAADIASVTLATTNKALYPVGNFPVLGSNYFGWLGKKISIELFGRITTGTTPGNGQWNVYWGTGADANGTSLQGSTFQALQASQNNLSWWAKFLCTCRAFGSGGALLVTGISMFNVAMVLSTAAFRSK